METIPGRTVEDGSTEPTDPDTERWARFGQAIYGDHRLSPAPLAAFGLVTVCTCGQPDAICPVRHLIRAFGLEDLSSTQWA